MSELFDPSQAVNTAPLSPPLLFLQGLYPVLLSCLPSTLFHTKLLFHAITPLPDLGSQVACRPQPRRSHCVLELRSWPQSTLCFNSTRLYVFYASSGERTERRGFSRTPPT